MTDKQFILTATVGAKNDTERLRTCVGAGMQWKQNADTHDMECVR